MNLRRLRAGSLEVVQRARFAYELAAPKRYLFVLSHMRSYSSLLCHILNSHPDIDGYVEMHRPYNTAMDLAELTLRVRQSNEQRLTGRYVVDKILHNYAINDDILKRGNVYTVFSLREPEAAVRSIIAMGRKRKKPDWKVDADKVVAHYVKRVNQLAAMAERKPRHSLYFDAQDIVDNTDVVLSTMTTFLKLDEPLRPQYETGAMSGKPSFGDPSKYILSGQIVQQRDDYGDIEVPDMETAVAAYKQARSRLQKAANRTVRPRKTDKV